MYIYTRPTLVSTLVTEEVSFRPWFLPRMVNGLTQIPNQPWLVHQYSRYWFQTWFPTTGNNLTHEGGSDPGIADQGSNPIYQTNSGQYMDLVLKCGRFSSPFWKARFQWAITYWLHLCKVCLFILNMSWGPSGPQFQIICYVYYFMSDVQNTHIHTHTHTHLHTFCC